MEADINTQISPGDAPPPTNIIARGIDRLTTLMGDLAGLALLSVAFIMAYETIMRRVFNNPTIWAYSISLFILVWFALLAAPLVMKDDRHISADFLISFFSDNVQCIIRIFGYIIALLFISALGYYGLEMCLEAFRRGRTSIELLRYPVWILFLIFPLTWALHFLQIPRKLIADIALLARKRLEGSNPLKDGMVLAVFIFLTALGLYLITVNTVLGLVILVLTLLFAGIPVAFSLGFTGLACLYLAFDGMRSLRVIPIITQDILHSYILLAIPLFVLGGIILYKSGVGEAIYDFASKWLSVLPGGLAVGTIGAATILSAMVGVTSAVAAAVGMIAIPSMISRGYPKGLSYGCVGGGAIGILFPPSAALIVYGFLTNSSVGRLFAAALVPALCVVAMFFIYVIFYCSLTGQYTKVSVTWTERFQSLFKVLPALLAPIIVLGGIYGGWFTPTEAAGVLTVYSLIIGFFYTRMNWEKFVGIIREGAIISTVVLIIIVGGKVLGQVVSHLRVPRIATEWLLSVDISMFAVVAGLFVIYIILGMFLDGVTITLLTVPVIYPMMPELGFDVIVFGVWLMILIELAHITPPVGLNLFMVKSVTNDRLWVISKGHFPFALLLLLAGIILYIYPELALWFPRLISG